LRLWQLGSAKYDIVAVTKSVQHLGVVCISGIAFRESSGYKVPYLDQVISIFLRDLFFTLERGFLLSLGSLVFWIPIMD
jgi:hypothetical protein